MGHIRLGRIPKTKPWQAVFGVLEKPNLNPAALANATASAIQGEFLDLERNRSINYCFWILVRLATSSRGDFKAELERIGVEPSKVSSGLSFVQHVAQVVGRELERRGESSVFVRMAELTLREVISSNIVEQSRSLFGTNLEDVQSACRTMSTAKNFGLVAKEFYASFMSRSIQYVADKELSNYVGPDGALKSIKNAVEFERSIYRYCYETAAIVEQFAGGWFSKNNWERNNDIPEDAAFSFTTYALQKIQMELRERDR